MAACLFGSEYATSIRKEYEDGEQKDKRLHEMSGFVAYEPWCRANCKTLEEAPVDPSWGSIEAKENDWLVAHACGLCDFRPPQVPAH